jgi:hypothetical protein
VLDTVASGRGSKLRVRRVNPLDHEASLKAFMTANGHDDFADFFDRGYHALVADGGASWVGFDGAGSIQMSLTQFVHEFQFRGARVRAGVTGNVMAAPPYRTFFPACALFRRMLSDMDDQHEVDLVYGDPSPQAVAICQAVKMQHIGNLDRLVLPIADAHVVRNIAARILSRAPLLLGGRIAPDFRCYPAAIRNLDEFEAPLGPHTCIVARHPISMLHRRLPEFPGSNDFVVELRWKRDAESWDALVLLRLDVHSRLLSILSVRRRPDLSLRAVVPALTLLARHVGAYRIQVETLVKSQMASEFRSLGFRHRGDILPVFVKGISAAGHELIRNADRWELTALDVER